ncbi:MAG: SDR family oxidoreductase, partial [Acholeplasmatales bacterium]|nr:SDR family oxidoreductase [Acholeplasmatales bacterium]
AKGYACNVLDKASIEKCHKEIVSDFGTCDILINGAGGNNPKGTTDNEYAELDDEMKDIKTFFDLDIKGIEFVFNLNFIGTLLPTLEFSKDMINNLNSSILNISSMNAFKPLTKIPAYSAAKASISNFTQWLATYFSKSGIRVNAIAPGFFATKQNEQLLFYSDGSLTERSKKIIRNTPMERFGKPEELIGSALFLSSPSQASFITGVILPIDGGFSAYSGV